MSVTERTGRPLVVTDCDEVLLHMVAPFRDWLGEEIVGSARAFDAWVAAG